MSNQLAASEAAGYVCGLMTRGAQVDVIVYWWGRFGDKYIVDVMAAVKSRKPKEFASLKDDVVRRWKGQKKATPKDG